MRSFEATAAMLNEKQGSEEEATARTLLAALLERVLRRHKFAADALVRQLEHERFIAV
jgi:predicted 2-oxoglutarate/Fe(II)-dependent dioxygenase YbiX